MTSQYVTVQDTAYVTPTNVLRK